MGVLEETKIIQAINRLEDIHALLGDVGRSDNRYSKRFSEINDELKRFQAELDEIRKAMNIENLGKKEPVHPSTGHGLHPKR